MLQVPDLYFSYRDATPQDLFSKLKRTTNIPIVPVSFCTYAIKKSLYFNFTCDVDIIYILICNFQAKEKLLIQLSMSRHAMSFP